MRLDRSCCIRENLRKMVNFQLYKTSLRKGNHGTQPAGLKPQVRENKLHSKYQIKNLVLLKL
jgi:hypothetical protein